MRLLLVGDAHGNIRYWIRLLEHIEKAEIEYDAILQLGDFGLWDHISSGVAYLDVLNNLILKKKCKELYWIDGNHENFDSLETYKVNSEGFRPIRSNIIHIPRAHAWTWDTKRLMGMGGAYSIDQLPRVAREMKGAPKQWWPQELITEEDVAAAKAVGKVDVLFSHDVPSGADYFGDAFWNATGEVLRPIGFTDDNRKMLRRVFDAVQPSELYHGHWHFRWRGTLPGCVVEGLSYDGSQYIRDTYTVVDV